METVSTRPNCPIAGIIVAAVLGAVGIIWSIAVLLRDTLSAPSAARAALFSLFPAIQALGSLANPLGLLGNTVLLIGALLSLAYHPQGERVVRITCIFMLSAVALFTLASFMIVSTSDHWSTLDSVTTGGIIGEIIGGAIGGMLQWGLILFLFRRSPTSTPIA